MPGTKAAREPKKQAGWTELGLNTKTLEAVRRVGFETPTDIQRELIPLALAGRDCLGQARTGTGKTAAFGLPVLQLLTPGGGVQALILVPTRELAVQVDEHIRLLAGPGGLKTVAILGGRGIKQQVATLQRHPEIAIGTPGRVQDLMRRKALSLDQVKLAVLDEVDRMLDIGFRDDIRRILRAIEHPHQTIFVSATLDEEIQKLAKSFMHDPAEVNVSRDMLTVEGVDQSFVTVHPEDKFATLVGLLKHEAPTLAIIFTNTKHKARRVAQSLKREGIDCREIHGDLVQERRERVMKSFRTQKTKVLVATDLASRGLDVMDISHIVNYDIPADPSGYVHRIGRTARMGKSGRAITFVTTEEGKFLTEVEKLINKELPCFDPPWLIKRQPTPTQIAAAVQAETEGPAAPGRYSTPRQRDEVLDSLGLRPVKRTLGSRFRSPRKFRR
ncbi:MAG TPA: DEAD/DEAH box helicase [Phycisphaerae bacterium]|jgi:ATP-dependent RNA helicase DeaD|nr:DEAD/DEAH box helicase [Phycisphaerae bacterium]HPM22611.1 DEAD/DEAH box helicase [Phycisphaerae bacterium]HQL54690.1 DEAD/DEAH box helicase [Phycisphaerae bacterium]